MLTIYRGNRADQLAQLLAAQLRLTPPLPLETVRVVVNTWPTSRWLGEQLATHLGGVVANVRFPFPASTLRQLVDLVLAEPVGSQEAPGPLPSGGQDPWRADQLVWAVLEAWPALASDAVAAPLNSWLGERDLGQRLDLASWQLARSIADAFDDYALYRPEMVLAWDQGQDVDGRRRPLGANQLWQPHLYRLLRRKLAREPFALRALAAMDRLRQPPSAALRARLAPFAGGLRLFGLSSLAPVQVQLLQALSAVLPVDLYLLTPCQDLWQRCVDRRQQLSDALALKEPLDLDWLRQAPGLEARFGRLGAEFQQLLEGTGEALLARQQELDLFFLPVTALAEGDPDQANSDQGDSVEAAPPLLLQLQQQLADAANPGPLVRSPLDTSLEFHGCPGPLRQVQIVRDRLLQLLAADSSLEPRDILVMTPAVDGFAPLLASVFGDREATGVDLPWRLTDRSQQSEAGIARTLLGLLRVAGDRFTATALEGLLEAQPLQARFGLTAPEVTELNQLLQRCGFRWGLDGHERGGDPTHSLAWVIDRLLLALVLPETPGLAPGGVAPAASGADLERTGRWLHLLTRLRHWLGQLRQPGTGAVWATRLQELLADLFGDGGEAAWELPVLQSAINAWQEAAGLANPLVLEAPVVAALLDEQLAIDSGRFGHRSGTLTISALEPMRAIPHRVIVLMGLDADLFPRQRNRPAFHLMEQQRLLGDPHPADQDRYVLMEALLSARDHLLITWSCRDERKGEERPPSAPVRQWLQWLQAQLGDQAKGLEIVHAASPLDRRNFLPQGALPPASCDRRLLAARQLLEQQPPPIEPWAAGPMPETPPPATPQPDRPAQGPSETHPQDRPQERFEALRQWLMAPQKTWLRELGLRPGEWARPLEDLEPLTLPERARVALLRQGLTAEGPLVAAGTTEDWLLWCRGTGQLPPHGGGALEARTLHRRWQTLQDARAALGPPHGEPLAWGLFQGAPQWQGDSVVVCHPAKATTAQFVDLWLQLLLAAACATTPRQGVLIARDSPDGFAAALTLQPLDGDTARQELERLDALAQRGRQVCWPVPPDSGWAWVSHEHTKAGSGEAHAAETWEGHVRRRGERLREEMVVCFGADLPASRLIDGAFGALATELYGPILAATLKP